MCVLSLCPHAAPSVPQGGKAAAKAKAVKARDRVSGAAAAAQGGAGEGVKGEAKKPVQRSSSSGKAEPAVRRPKQEVSF